jgi:hypothetical protein
VLDRRQDLDRRLEAGRPARLRSRSVARTARSRVDDAARRVHAGPGLALFFRCIEIYIKGYTKL